MIRFLIVLFFFLPLICPAQNFIGKTKSQVKKILNQEIKKNDSLTITLTDNDSALVYSIAAGKSLPADFIYSFDKRGKCQSEKIIATCDSCFTKYLQQVLDDKKFEWKKINENQYISKYSAHRMIELSGDNKNFSYMILQTDWDKALYQMLTGQ